MSGNTQHGTLRRVFGALTWGAWVVALVTILVAILGSKDEIRGNVAFSLIVGAVLVVLTMIPALLIGTHTRDASRVCWITLTVTVLGFTAYMAGLDHPEARRDASNFFAIAMTVLTFPLGLAALVFGPAISKLTSGSSTQFQILIWSIVFLGAGYIQWWRIIPTLLRRFISRDSREVDTIAPRKSS